MANEIKLVTIDIDKTLIDDNMHIPEDNIVAINKAVEKGCNVVLCSGRSGSSVRKYMQALNLKGLVPSLGGCMLEKYDGTVINDYNISCDDAQTIYSIARKYDQYPLVFKHGNWYADPENTYWIQKEIDATNIEGRILNLKEFLKDNRPNKMVIPSEDTELLKNVRAELTEKLCQRIANFLSSSSYLEVMPKGVTKGTAVNDLIRYLGITRDNVLAIGDYYNDVDMFNAAGNKATVLNAPEDIKEMVDYVCPVDNNHAAVARIIEKYVLEV